jgi:hypothetical protein
MRKALTVLQTIGQGFAGILGSLTEELAIAVGLVLIAIGCWDFWRPGSTLFPGLVLLWLFTPQRKSFIERQTAIQPRRRKDSN